MCGALLTWHLLRHSQSTHLTLRSAYFSVCAAMAEHRVGSTEAGGAGCRGGHLRREHGRHLRVRRAIVPCDAENTYARCLSLMCYQLCTCTTRMAQFHQHHVVAHVYCARGHCSEPGMPSSLGKHCTNAAISWQTWPSGAKRQRPRWRKRRSSYR